MDNSVKTVYTCFATDIIHEGHLKVIAEGCKYGRMIVGVLSDRALIRYNRFPTVSLERRIENARGISGVSEVLVQEDIMYDKIISEIRPDYIIHGDNWRTGPIRAIRDNTAALLSGYGGRLIEIPYSFSENISLLEKRSRAILAMPEYRRKRLRQLISICPAVKALEVHSGLTGLIAEKTVAEHNGELDQFDAMWISSLCDSTAKGKPDTELVDMTSRFGTVDEITEVTTKPIIFDGDTGGQPEHFVYTVRTLEKMGVSAVIIEDKRGHKRNSLFGTDVSQTQDSIESFCAKITAGKKAQLTDDFMIIARIESLILDKGMEDALERARAYVNAGADGIMIHSRRNTPDEVFEFCDRFRKSDKSAPLVAVPTAYSRVTEDELAAHGVNIIIYANHLTRSAFPAMQKTAEDILKYHRAFESEENLMSINEIINLIDEI